jgi:hypothetical protein
VIQVIQVIQVKGAALLQPLAACAGLGAPAAGAIPIFGPLRVHSVRVDPESCPAIAREDGRKRPYVPGIHVFATK